MEGEKRLSKPEAIESFKKIYNHQSKEKVLDIHGVIATFKSQSPEIK